MKNNSLWSPAGAKQCINSYEYCTFTSSWCTSKKKFLFWLHLYFVLSALKQKFARTAFHFLLSNPWYVDFMRSAATQRNTIFNHVSFGMEWTGSKPTLWNLDSFCTFFMPLIAFPLVSWLKESSPLLNMSSIDHQIWICVTFGENLLWKVNMCCVLVVNSRTNVSNVVCAFLSYVGVGVQ